MYKNLLFLFIFYKMYIDYNETFIQHKKKRKNRDKIII